jgi:uncharacterized membrane protein YfcA
VDYSRGKRKAVIPVSAGTDMKENDFVSSIEETPVYVAYIFPGLVVGVLVAFMGISGGVILVPAMVYLLHLSQHTSHRLPRAVAILVFAIGLWESSSMWRK